MMMSNLSGEQGIDSAINLCTQGAMAAFRFAKWFMKASEAKGANQTGTLISDACSAYRGGFVKNSGNPELNTLLSDLSGIQIAPSGGNFIFFGDKSDLSYFWKKAAKDQPTVLLKQHIDSIPDEKLRVKVLSEMNKARADGLLAYDGRSFSLTEAGKKAVLKPNFIVSRLKKEAKQLERAAVSLAKDANVPMSKQGSFDTDDFFEAAMRRSQTMLKSTSSIEGRYEVFLPYEDKPRTFNITNSFEDKELNTTYYGMISKNNLKIDLPKEAFGVIAFKNAEEGKAYIREFPETVKECQKIFEDMGLKYTVPGEKWTETEDAYSVELDQTYERLNVPKSEAVKLDDERLQLDLDRNGSYRISTGNVGYNVDGERAMGNISRHYATTAVQSSTSVQTATKTIGAVADAIPPVEGVSAAAKTVMTAIAKIGDAASASVSVADQGISLSQKL